MSGLLTAAGILGSLLFSIGWNSDARDPIAEPMTWMGAGMLGVAAIAGLLRLFV